MAKSAKEYLDAEVNRFAEQARTVVRGAETENRPLTADERGKVEELIARTTELKSRIAEQDANDALLAAVEGANSVITGRSTTETAPAANVGEAFVKSEAYQALKARGLKGRWSTGPIEFGGKADDGNGHTIQSITDAGGALPLQPQVLPILGPVEQKLMVADLFGQGTATQNSIVYLEETTTVPGALVDPYDAAHLPGDPVETVEGAAKPNANINFTKRTTAVEKIAAFLPISDEMLEDEPQISSYITGRLPLFVRQAEEAYLLETLNATGSATPEDIEGDPTSMFDAIAAGIMEVLVFGGLDADAVLINPADFWQMAVKKAVGGTGMYFSGGPYAGPAQNPWGVTAVVTSAVAKGAPVVGAFRSGATVFRKGGLSVEASNSHADYFARNLTALRAEERLALVTLRPKAFCVVSTS